MAAARRPEVIDQATEIVRGMIMCEDRQEWRINNVENENQDLIHQNRVMRKTIHDMRKAEEQRVADEEEDSVVTKHQIRILAGQVDSKNSLIADMRDADRASMARIKELSDSLLKKNQEVQA